MAQIKPLKPNTPHGAGYRAPEILNNPRAAFDGEKADVFAAACVLIAIYTINRFCNVEQVHSQFYRLFLIK
jgi:hypothetical protein